MMASSVSYCAYIIRGWTEQLTGSDERVWRFRLHDVQQGSDRGFASIEALLAFLEEELAKGGSPGRDPPPSSP